MTEPNAPPPDDTRSDDTLPDDTLAEQFDLGIDVDEFADAIVDVPVTEPTPAGETVGFFDAGPGTAALDDLQLAERVPVLERLGPAHFRSKGFSFMGFLQTVYEQVAAETTGEKPADESA